MSAGSVWTLLQLGGCGQLRDALEASWTDLGVSWVLLEAPRGPERKVAFCMFVLLEISATEDSTAKETFA